jgi:hypothetical protein
MTLRLIHDDIDDPNTGTRVALTRDGHTVWEGRWPGPHRRGEIIGSTDGGCFVLDYLDTAASGGPVAVYRGVADRENP